TGIEVTVKFRLEQDADYIDSELTVSNSAGTSERTVHAVFPYFSGLHIGEPDSDNFVVDMWDRGYPGTKAWERPNGGVYGKEVSMQWQCVYGNSPSADGLSFIVMDTALMNKVLCTFPKGGMQAFYLDGIQLGPNAVYCLPSARIQVFSGG